MKEFKFFQITDLHLYDAKRIGSYGKFFENRCITDQKCVEESPAIVDAAFQKFIDDKEVEYVIISGDLTYDGEKENHAALLEKLEVLKNAGKKVYVTFATHDYYMDAKRYTDEGVEHLEVYTRQELREFYKDYGWQDAVAEHVPSYSYAVVPCEGLRLLMLNDDGNGRQFCGYYDDLIEWIENQCKEAKEKSERIIAVTHHPVLPPSIIYPLFSHRDMLGNYETLTPRLADMGIEYFFTGHTHMQNIDYIDTAKGNRLYHINTGSAIAYPCPYRKVTVGEHGVDVKTFNIDNFECDLKGRTYDEYVKDHFTFMIRDLFDSLENDIEHFKIHAGGISMDETFVDKFKPVLTLLGKIINNVTFKSLGRFTLISSKIDKSIADKRFMDVALDMVVGVFTGIKNYPPNTPEYKALMALAKRLSPVVKLKNHDGSALPFEKLMEDLLHDTGDYDNTNAFLPY